MAITDQFLIPIGQLAALFVIILGVFWVIFAGYEANRRKSWRKLTKVEEWDFNITAFLKFLTALGFFVGLFCIFSGVAGLILNIPPSIAYQTQTANERNYFTSIFLIVLGILTLMKPLNDLPIPSIVGFLVAGGVTIAIAFLIPDSAVALIENYIDPKIVLIVIFFIIFTIVGLTMKFYLSGVMFMSKILSFPPFALIVAGFCFVQGFALLIYGVSIV
ncbi:MAG: hypothetical protein ACTSUN_07615 [Promethearchaeota archaeon]